MEYKDPFKIDRPIRTKDPIADKRCKLEREMFHILCTDEELHESVWGEPTLTEEMARAECYLMHGSYKEPTVMLKKLSVLKEFSKALKKCYIEYFKTTIVARA